MSKNWPQWSGKLWRGKKRLGQKMVQEGSIYTRLLRWAMTVKIGDYIATCEGCNRKVVKIEPEWANEGYWNRSKENKTFFLHEVVFTDTHGRWHYCPGGGCASPAETPEQVTEYFRSLCFDEEHVIRMQKGGWDPQNQLSKIRVALEAGRPIVDEHGELLADFDV